MNKSLALLFLFSFLVLPSISSAFFDVSLKYGSRGEAVIELQDFLEDQGFYTGKVDGRFGLGTRKAVIAFQTANDLKPDGYFGVASRAKATTIIQELIAGSDETELEETGVVGDSVVDTDATVLQSQVDNLSDQLSAVTTQLQQITQNTTPVPSNESLLERLRLQNQTVLDGLKSVQQTPPVVDNTPKEVNLADLQSTVMVHGIRSYLALISVKNTLKGDRVTLTFEDKVYNLDLWTLESPHKEVGFSLYATSGQMPNSIGYNLTPDTEYTYTVKIERGNKFAVSTGKFRTLLSN